MGMLTTEEMMGFGRVRNGSQNDSKKKFPYPVGCMIGRKRPETPKVRIDQKIKFSSNDGAWGD